MSLRRSLFCAAAGSVVLSAGTAAAHPVVVDGSAAEWFTRVPTAANVGMVARNAASQGELVWLDALADTRTDLSMPEVVADIAAFQVTGSPQGLSFLIRRQPGVAFTGSPIQVQIAIDTDRVADSGQEFLAAFADTKVSNGARWERLVQTLFGSGGTAQVIDTSFNKVADGQAVAGVSGDVEIAVPWSALGMSGPPSSPLRLSVATFRAQANDLTVDLGGAMFSNAIDVVSNYGDPRASAYPNTYQAVQSTVLDYWLDVWFDDAGEVIAPILVQRFLSNASGGGADEWYEVRNNTAASLALDGFKLGDEETPDGNEGMFAFPATTTLASGATVVIARSGSAYQAFFGKAPDAELPPGASMAVPDMAAFTAWTDGAAGTMQLANAGDEILALDPSSTIVDIAVFGTGEYAGVQSFGSAPGTDEALSRAGDTDNCQVDFSNAGKVCTADAQCGGICHQCAGNVCGTKPAGAACPDPNPCDGDEICDGSGACVAGTVTPCNDTNACTTDGCTPANGCTHTPLQDGISCSDDDVCNGAETCKVGVCSAGTALDCNDSNPCTLESCDSTTGCSSVDVALGVPCSDGNACNGAETCDGAGVCLPGDALSCDDQNICTTDACDPSTGCAHAPVTPGTACSDADVCNGAETCNDLGNCVPGQALDCDDDNECTVDSCDGQTGCQQSAAADGTVCNAVCTGTCTGGVCACADGGAGGAAGQAGSAGQGGEAGTSSGGAGTGGASTGGAAGSAGSSTGGAAGTGTGGSAGSSAGGAGGTGGSAGSAAGSAGATSKGGSAGAGGSDGGIDAGPQPTVPDAEDSGGCGCRTAEGAGTQSGFWLLSLVAVLFGRRKRGSAAY